MQIRPVIVVLFLATSLASPAVAAIGAPWSGLRFALTAQSSGGILAVLQAPVGHRQPTLDDLPDWLRDIDGPGIEGSKPAQKPQPGSEDAAKRDEHIAPRRAPDKPPNYGTPLICDGC
jgi:hypothetical protein